jgi:Fe2+ or Zn2+ uptake regulation protein
MFKDIFGKGPQTNILDFLLDHPEFDYSISEIAKHSHVSRPTVYKTIDVLLEKQLVVITRAQGNSQLFKVNVGNSLVQKMLNFECEVAKNEQDDTTSDTARGDDGSYDSAVTTKRKPL